MAFPCIVHLDLKGAPWRLNYLYKIISFMKDNGAWGVLIEWEDTFPYTSELVDIGSLGGSNREGMYSQDEVNQILQFIKNNGLEPIQLVQTIGHMEFVLKHEKFSHLRELAHSPAVLCPSRPGALELAQAIVSQVLDAQPDASYIHIGADEVWHLNKCADCQKKPQWSGPATLYLEHIKALATFVRQKYRDVNVLMWDDMIRNVDAGVLNGYSLGMLIQPVVWNYEEKERFHLDSQMWRRYALVFPKIWAASAFKGANGCCQMLCSAKRYASNQLAWREEMTRCQGDVTFCGIILTGWSRYDHYATLCELLPAALPSLASCLRMWTQPDGFTNENAVSEQLPAEQWCGHDACAALRGALELRTRALSYLHGDQVTSWLNPWQLASNYTSPLQAENITSTAKLLLSEFEPARRTLSAALIAITGPRSTVELLHTWLAPAQGSLAALAAAAGARAAAPAGVTPRASDAGRHEPQGD